MKPLSCLMLLALGCAHAAAPAPWEMKIWPGAVPDPQTLTGPEESGPSDNPVAGKHWKWIGRVSDPTMTIYPARGKNTGAAVLVFPGGGYQILAIDLEGSEVCDWLTPRGITCVVLKYRVPGKDQLPKSGAYPRSPVALEDAQRAVGLVRFHAAEWHVDPHKIGVLGFSAGGHLVAAVGTNYDKRLYPRVDDADETSCRPDFVVSLYPGHMLENTESDFELNPGVPVTADTPPTIIVQAEDDPVDDVENSLVLFEALRKAGVAAEMHLYAHGGHGFGLRPTELPITGWPKLVEAWLHTIGMI